MSPSAADGPVLARVAAILRSHGVDDFAFTGGIAVGVWAQPRQTRDVDVCGVLRPDEIERLLALRDGIRSGPEPLPDMVRFRVGEWDVDLFVCKDEYDRTCLGRAVAATVDGVDLRVVTAEDLVIHKMIKLRTDRRRLLQDLADIRAVIDAQGTSIDRAYLRRWLPDDDDSLLDAISSADDEAIARAVLTRDRR